MKNKKKSLNPHKFWLYQLVLPKNINVNENYLKMYQIGTQIALFMDNLNNNGLNLVMKKSRFFKYKKNYLYYLKFTRYFLKFVYLMYYKLKTLSKLIFFFYIFFLKSLVLKKKKLHTQYNFYILYLKKKKKLKNKYFKSVPLIFSNFFFFNMRIVNYLEGQKYIIYFLTTIKKFSNKYFKKYLWLSYLTKQNQQLSYKRLITSKKNKYILFLKKKYLLMYKFILFFKSMELTLKKNVKFLYYKIKIFLLKYLGFLLFLVGDLDKNKQKKIQYSKFLKFFLKFILKKKLSKKKLFKYLLIIYSKMLKKKSKTFLSLIIKEFFDFFLSYQLFFITKNLYQQHVFAQFKKNVFKQKKQYKKRKKYFFCIKQTKFKKNKIYQYFLYTKQQWKNRLLKQKQKCYLLQLQNIVTYFSQDIQYSANINYLKVVQKKIFQLLYLQKQLEITFSAYYNYQILFRLQNLFLNTKTPKILGQLFKNGIKKHSTISLNFLQSFLLGFYLNSAELLVKQIARQLELIGRGKKHSTTIKYIYRLLTVLKTAGFDCAGFQVLICGKINAKTQTKVVYLRFGQAIKTNTFIQPLTYAMTEALTYTGTFGIHIWLSK